jgi:hypothetical protein
MVSRDEKLRRQKDRQHGTQLMMGSLAVLFLVMIVSMFVGTNEEQTVNDGHVRLVLGDLSESGQEPSRPAPLPISVKDFRGSPKIRTS